MLSDFRQLPKDERIIVAFDCDKARALELADQLAGAAKWVKIGMTLYYAEGPSIIQEMKNRGFKVFLDLKFHDIPHQVRGAARSAAATGADMLTMHAVGGLAMMQAGHEGALEGNPCEPVTLGITVLTSMDAETLAATGVVRPVEEQVVSLAKQAREAGLTGVVASPREAAMLREALGPEAYIVTPGVRPAGSDIGDQSRVATPAQAFENGASHLVIGRPITGAENPRAAFEAIVADLQTV